jgi:hypothetical protein
LGASETLVVLALALMPFVLAEAAKALARRHVPPATARASAPTATTAGVAR